MLNELDKAGIGLTSATFEIVGLPTIRLTFDSAGNPTLAPDERQG